MPTSTFTTIQICTYNPVTNTYALALDLNDRTTFYNISLKLDQPEKVYVRSFNIRTPGENVSQVQYKNRHIVGEFWIKGATTNAVLSSVRSLLSSEENPPYYLRLALPGTSTLYSYIQVKAIKHNIPNEASVILAGAINKIQIDFECDPYFRGDLIQLQNGIVNPGFEAPSNMLVPCFIDNLTNTSFYKDTINQYVNIIFGQNPLRYYRLDEVFGTTAYDLMQNGNNGTLHGIITQGSSGALNSGGGWADPDASMTFDGSTGYITGNATNLPTGAASWSLSAWIYFTANPGSTRTVCSWGLNSTAHGAPQFTIDSSGRAQLSDATTSTAVSAALSLSTWHHLVGTYDGTTMRMYIDGVAGNTVAATCAIPASSTFMVLGATALASPTQFFPGRIDEVSVYSSVLTAAEITNMYKSGNGTLTPTALTTDTYTYADAVQADSPLRYYRLDEVSGTTAYDAMGTAYNGTLNGGITQNVSGALTGDVDTAYAFNGTTGYVSYPTTGLPTGNANVTIEGWIYPTATPGSDVIPLWLGTWFTAGQIFYIAFTSANKLYATNGNQSTPSSSAIALNTWHHCVATYNGSIISLYVDGSLVGSSSATTNNITYGQATIGAAGGGGVPFTGRVDEVAIYTTALSSTRITAHYNAGHNAPTSNSNSMVIASGNIAPFGTAWNPFNQWKVRFRYFPSASTNAPYQTAQFWISNDSSYGVFIEVSQTTMAVFEKLSFSGAASNFIINKLSTVSGFQLVPGIDYWMVINAYLPIGTSGQTVVGLTTSITCYIATDAGGAPSTTHIATIVGATTSNSNSAFSLSPAISAVNANIAIGGSITQNTGLLAAGNYANEIWQLGPGGWSLLFAPTTDYGMMNWYYANGGANGYQNGPTQSNYSLAVLSTVANQYVYVVSGTVINYTTSQCAINSLFPTTAGATIYWSIAAMVTGGTGGASTTTNISLIEYDSTGTPLRIGQNNLQSSNFGWTKFLGHWTTGANCAYVGFSVYLIDTASTAATLYLDNAQIWDATATGLTTMPYCELRSTFSPAQFMVSGIVGDVPAISLAALGVYVTNAPNGYKLNFWIGRKQRPSANFIGIQAPLYVAGIGLDATAWAGYSIPYQQPQFATLNINSQLGRYHFYTIMSLSAPIVNTFMQLTVQQGNTLIGVISGIQLAVVYGGWAAGIPLFVDGGYATVPLGGTDYFANLASTGIYYQLLPFVSNIGGTIADQSLVWFPVDGDVILGSWNVVSGSPVISSGTWLYLYADSFSQMPQFTISGLQLATPGTAVMGLGSSINTGLGAYMTYTGDTKVFLDPTQTTVTNQTNTGVNQFIVHAQDNSGVCNPMALDLYYFPQYLYPR